MDSRTNQETMEKYSSGKQIQFQNSASGNVHKNNISTEEVDGTSGDDSK